MNKVRGLLDGQYVRELALRVERLRVDQLGGKKVVLEGFSMLSSNCSGYLCKCRLGALRYSQTPKDPRMAKQGVTVLDLLYGRHHA